MEKYSHRLPKITSESVEFKCLAGIYLTKLTLIPQLHPSHIHILYLFIAAALQNINLWKHDTI